MARRRAVSLALAVVVLLAGAVMARGQEGSSSFERDLAELCKGPHRLAGSPEGRAAGDYLLERARGMLRPWQELYVEATARRSIDLSERASAVGDAAALKGLTDPAATLAEEWESESEVWPGDPTIRSLAERARALSEAIVGGEAQSVSRAAAGLKSAAEAAITGLNSDEGARARREGLRATLQLPRADEQGRDPLTRIAPSALPRLVVLDFPLLQTSVDRCQVTIGGATGELLPLQPDLIVPPVTPEAGVRGRWLYAGKGEVADYGDRDPAGAIVALDYDCGDRWQTAFAMGASAVVFLGDAASTPLHPKNVALPANLIRLYAPARTVERLALRGDHASATVHSAASWRRSQGRNILVHLPGTAPIFAKQDGGLDRVETLVLSAAYDSFGVVPQLSPGARGAANAAALLGATERLLSDRPRRDVLIALVDNQARYHEGARYLYEWLMMSQTLTDAMAQDHRSEHRFVAQMRALLAVLPGGGADVPSTVRDVLLDRLEKQGEFVRSDVNQRLVETRLLANRLAKERSENPPGPSGSAEPRGEAGVAERGRRADVDQRVGQLLAEVERLRAEVMSWDGVRRSLHQRRPGDIPEEQFRVLRDRLDHRLRSREEELTRAMRMDRQRVVLRALLQSRRVELGREKDLLPWIALHVSYNLSGDGPGWGVVAGDWTERGYFGNTRPTQGDLPGFYSRVMGAMRDAASAAGAAVSRLDRRTLDDPTMSGRHVPGRYVSSGAVAGTHGIFNLSLVGVFDGRLRDGHPIDTPERLNLEALREHAREATELIRAAADVPSLSLPRQFQSLAMSRWPSWDGERAAGNYVGLQITGSLSEDRAASGAVLAVMPRGNVIGSANWDFIRAANVTPGFDPLVLTEADANGRFPLVSLRNQDLFAGSGFLGALFDPRGAVSSITTQETAGAQNVSATAIRVNLMPADGRVAVSSLLTDPTPLTLNVLMAASDSAYRKNKSLLGQQEDVTFFYVSSLLPPQPLKVFQAAGPVILNASSRNPIGDGVDPESLALPVNIDRFTANDLWMLNESRFRALRSRGVTNVDLEVLHSRAKQGLEQVERARTVLERQTLLKQSQALSRAVYAPLRKSMDDLVTAIVVLLLLAIPFAFALERLLVAATTIYQRLAGFAVCFVLTFLLLFFMHPGFAIASTPVIIFLAFTILLLSGLVIFIIVRKFRTELAAMQGQGTAVHRDEVSAMATALAAVSMGMSTMRRRPTRTLLTAVTVVMLTFTILCFASVSTKVGVRSIGEGPANQDVSASIMVRHLNYKGLSPHLLTLLAGSEGRGGLIADQWWLVRASSEHEPFSVSRTDTPEAMWVEGVIGLRESELERWPQLAATLGPADREQKVEALRRGGVFLPSVVQDRLRLKPGDPILFHGRPTFFAGPLEPGGLQRLSNLDNRSAMPIDPLDAAQQQSQTNITPEMEDLIEKDFVHLSPDQLAVTSAELVRGLGGSLRIVNIYVGQGLDSLAGGRDIARMVTTPVWARGPQGVDRMVFTNLTEFVGGMGLLVPIVLGGLIIFGTLLGSISDREREIYTFSALGLAPKHVGFLFFAEAAVYAVVGGMGGQLLAQFVALIAPHVARLLDMNPPSINYSSTNSLFAIGLVMSTVMISAIYPALRASKSANPGLARSWKMPPPRGDELAMTFPFTVSAYDITGVISFLAEHFRAHSDAGLGQFASTNVAIQREEGSGHLMLSAHLALAPFDLGVTQDFWLTARPSEIPGVDEVVIRARRASGAGGDWTRANRVFVQDLRKQFLLWRTLSAEVIESYRLRTIEELGDARPAAADAVDGD